MHIHAYTYQYIHIHTNTYIYTLPVKPLVDCHDYSWERIRHALVRRYTGVVLCDCIVSQTIQNVRETQHQLLHIASIDYG